MADTTDRPQILEHISKSLSITIYDTKWVPSSARLVVLGAYARNTGSMQVYELDGTELKLLSETEKKHSLKCGTFGASSLLITSLVCRQADRHLATGNFNGDLEVWDLEKTATPVFQSKAHVAIINGIDGAGGPQRGYGAPEIATCGRDGNSFNDEERCVLAGYDSGDVKMFDLRTGTLRWETNVGNGVCAVEFDRKDIPMNKFTAATLESRLHVFDARTQHPTNGFASAVEKARAFSLRHARTATNKHTHLRAHCSNGSTVWCCRHLPQNRDVCMVGGGNGSLSLYKYSYPDNRSKKDFEGLAEGVAGKLELLADRPISSQPISCFDWSPDKAGLAVFGAFDQCVRVGIVTKLNKV
eukprot:jgi/Chlat1/2486/Chrsp175S02361